MLSQRASCCDGPPSIIAVKYYVYESGISQDVTGVSTTNSSSSSKQKSYLSLLCFSTHPSTSSIHSVRANSSSYLSIYIILYI